MLEDVWIEALYGHHATLQNETWLEKVSQTKECKFVFNATLLREKLFEKAGVQVKHSKVKSHA